MASEKPSKSPRYNLDYCVPGRLMRVISDGSKGANFYSLMIARQYELSTSGRCKPETPEYLRHFYNLRILSEKPEETILRTGGVVIQLQTEKDLFRKRSIENILLSDGVLIFNIGRNEIIRELIGFCLLRKLSVINDDYSRFPFFYWQEQKLFVVNTINLHTARTFRNFIAMNPDITNLAIIGDDSTFLWPIIPFFQKAFRIKKEKNSE